MNPPSPPAHDSFTAPRRGSQERAAAPGAGDGSFAWPVRIYYEDTDAGGVVYYANYLRYLERCRTEWMRSLGFGQAELAQRDGVVFVVAAVEIKYLRSARLDDALVVTARVAQRYASYVVFEQQIHLADAGHRLCTARVKVACVDARTMRPTRLPPGLAAAVATDPASTESPKEIQTA